MSVNTTYVYIRNKFSEPLRIARCTLKINDFIPRSFNLFSRMMTQGGNKATSTKQLKNGLSSLPNCFSKSW